MNTNETTQAAELDEGNTNQAQQADAAEEAASMGALLALAQQEAPIPGAQGEGVELVEQEPARVALSVELADAISASVMLLDPIFPSLQRVYTPQTVERLAVATERVCIKRGWLANGLFAGASEEVMLAAVLIPVSLSTWAAIKGDLIRAKVEEKPWLGWLARITGWGKRKAKPLPDEQPGAAAVTMGTAPAMGAAA